jgi:hypothetical protein
MGIQEKTQRDPAEKEKERETIFFLPVGREWKKKTWGWLYFFNPSDRVEAIFFCLW